MTKLEVKMADIAYWLSSFFFFVCVFMDRDDVVVDKKLRTL